MESSDPFDAIENRMLAVHRDADLVLFGGVPASSTHALNGAVVMGVAEPKPHWLIVSQGFTELWNKVSPDPAVSGLGFELSCRIPAHTDKAGTEVGWVLKWMQGVADALASSNTSLAHAHWMEVLSPSHADEVCALAFVRDLQLGGATSRNGSFVFLQMVGLRMGELEILKASSVEHYVEHLRRRDPLLWIDPRAPSPLRDESFRESVDPGGVDAATRVVTGVAMRWNLVSGTLHLVLGVEGIEDLIWALEHRLAEGESMVFFGHRDDANAVLAVLPESGSPTREVRDGKEGCVLRVGAALEELRAVLPTLRTAPRRVHLEAIGLIVEVEAQGSLF